MLVKHRMTPDPVSVRPSDTLAHALKLTREHRVRHLPVVEGGEIVGIVSDRDIRLAMPSPLAVPDPERAAFLEGTAVADIMAREVITVGPFDTVEDAAVLLHRHRVGSVPVVDALGRLLGILTETDILHAFVEILGSGGPSSRIEVALPDRPGELSRALRILGEEQRLNVSGVMVLPVARADGTKVTVLHVATIDPRVPLAALEQAGYEVGWPSLEWDLRRGADR